MPPPHPRTLKERVARIQVLTEELLRARHPSPDANRISALLRQELEAAHTIVNKRPISDE